MVQLHIYATLVVVWLWQILESNVSVNDLVWSTQFPQIKWSVSLLISPPYRWMCSHSKHFKTIHWIYQAVMFAHYPIPLELSRLIFPIFNQQNKKMGELVLHITLCVSRMNYPIIKRDHAVINVVFQLWFVIIDLLLICVLVSLLTVLFLEMQIIFF